jgi:hypothetical protein
LKIGDRWTGKKQDKETTTKPNTSHISYKNGRKKGMFLCVLHKTKDIDKELGVGF